MSYDECITILQHLIVSSVCCLVSLFIQVTVRCGCQTLKKEWLCQDVQAAYHKAGREPKDIAKNQFGVGLLPCNSDCRSKIQTVQAELQSRKPNVSEVTYILVLE